MGKNKKYTQDYKLKIVKEAIQTKNNAMVAHNHELSPNMVSRWVREYKAVGENNFLAGKVPSKRQNNKPTDLNKRYN